MASLVAGEAAIALPMDFAVEGEAALIQIGRGFRGWQGLSVILAGSKENIKKKKSSMPAKPHRTIGVHV